MIINRDYERCEADDFALNIEPRLNGLTEVLPLYHEGFLFGWKIQNRYE